MLSIIGATLLSLLSFTVNVAGSPAYAAETIKPSVQALISSTAAEYGIASTTLYNLAYNESKFNTTAISPTGDYGIVQINLKQPPILKKGQAPITQADAFDPVFALAFAAKAIALNKQSAWTVCNCYSYVKARVPSFPLQQYVHPTSMLGDTKVAIFNYYGVPHYAIVTSTDESGFWVQDSNFTPCQVQTHHILWGDSHLIGYWSP